MDESKTLTATKDPKTFLDERGARVSPPVGWVCVRPGDPGLTRRVKAAGPSWTVVERKGKKLFSHGVWAPAANVGAARDALESERADPAYARRLASDAKRRAVAQADYVEDFRAEVLKFLRFSARYEAYAGTLAEAVSDHATPVGSGTVARTQRIPIERRAEAALIAWMRHQTTAYDNMDVARVKGERRRVRAYLAEISRAVLDLHRGPSVHAPAACPLCMAIARIHRAKVSDAAE
ncbi:MAG: DUF2293 domain-containing protein [Deltaproteobacteria bacterium]|nr:DUF2293 domain-containing protein [Deltaproteobacteria bacterium]